MKKITFILSIFISLSMYSQSQWEQIGSDIDGEAADDRSGESIDLSADGSIVAIGASGNESNGELAGHVRVFENVNASWVQVGDDIDGASPNDGFGRSLSLSADGSVIAIGGTGNDEGGMASGQVRVFEYKNENWVQIGDDINGKAAFDAFGISTSLSSDGRILAVGATGNDSNGNNSGQVRVFQNQNDNWIQIGSDLNGEAVDDRFGLEVSLSSNGTILSAGAPFNDGNGVDSGHVRVFQNQSGNWVQIGEDINGEASGDSSCANSLSADCSIIAVGASANNGNGPASGHVRIFKNDGDSWSQIGNDIDGEAAFDNSGRPGGVKINDDGSVVAIGALGNTGNGTFAGHVRVYQNQSESWVQIGQDIEGDAENDFSGENLSLNSDGSILAIGAVFNDGNGMDSGHVRVFKNDALLSTRVYSQTKISIYPNPSKGMIYIEGATIHKVEAFDITGRNRGVIYLQDNKIDLSGTEKGVLFLRIHTDSGVETVKAVLID
jgi:hypothetical protein